jgi:hypothetical protein
MFTYVSGGAYAFDFDLLGYGSESDNRILNQSFSCISKGYSKALSASHFGSVSALNDEIKVDRSWFGWGKDVTMSEQASLADISFLGGLVKANLIQSSALITGDDKTASSSNTSEFVGLNIVGHPIPVFRPAPNTVIQLPDLGTVTLNEQDTLGATDDNAGISVTAIDIAVSLQNRWRLPIGEHIRIAHVDGRFVRTPILPESCDQPDPVTPSI